MADNLFSPNKFLSELNGSRGPAKSSLYDVRILPPPIFVSLGTSYRKYLEPLSMLCESAEMPGKSFVTENVRIYGPGYNVPYLTTYQNIALTFLCTNVHTERLLFDLWMDSAISPRTNNARFPKGNGSNYLTNIEVTQYDLQEKPIYRAKLIDAFPLSIAPQQLSWADDAFQRLTVSFLYQKYESDIIPT
tara:strand:+ start:297 stop:866 length:570 start_codon:yes stop_codon:yes gene_type:complete